MINLSISILRHRLDAAICMQAGNSCSHSLVCQSMQRSLRKSGAYAEVLLSFAVSPEGERNVLDPGREVGTPNISHFQPLSLREPLKAKKKRKSRSTLYNSLSCNRGRNEFEIPWVTPGKTSVGSRPSPKQLRLLTTSWNTFLLFFFCQIYSLSHSPGNHIYQDVIRTLDTSSGSLSLPPLSEEITTSDFVFGF